MSKRPIVFFAAHFLALVLFQSNAWAVVDTLPAAPAPSHSPAGFWIYDYQALLGTSVAFLALLVTFAVSERNRNQKLAFFSILREDLSLLKEDVEDQIKVLRDVCSEISDQEFSRHITPEHIERVLTASKPRVGAALIDDWKIVEFLSDANIVQYLERVNNYLKNLEEAVDWCKSAILEMQRSQTFGDVEDVKNYVEVRGSRLFAAIEQLRCSMAAGK